MDADVVYSQLDGGAQSLMEELSSAAFEKPFLNLSEEEKATVLEAFLSRSREAASERQ